MSQKKISRILLNCAGYGLSPSIAVIELAGILSARSRSCAKTGGVKKSPFVARALLAHKRAAKSTLQFP